MTSLSALSERLRSHTARPCKLVYLRDKELRHVDIKAPKERITKITPVLAKKQPKPQVYNAMNKERVTVEFNPEYISPITESSDSETVPKDSASTIPDVISETTQEESMENLMKDVVPYFGDKRFYHLDNCVIKNDKGYRVNVVLPYFQGPGPLVLHVPGKKQELNSKRLYKIVSYNNEEEDFQVDVDNTVIIPSESDDYQLQVPLDGINRCYPILFTLLYE
jgi:hypothetical protein